MTFMKKAAGVTINLPDGGVIKGFPDAAITLSGQGTTERQWTGRLAFPPMVWQEYGHQLKAETEYKIECYAAGRNWSDVVWILSLPEFSTGSYVYVECRGPEIAD